MGHGGVRWVMVGVGCGGVGLVRVVMKSMSWLDDVEWSWWSGVGHEIHVMMG